MPLFAVDPFYQEPLLMVISDPNNYALAGKVMSSEAADEATLK